VSRESNLRAARYAIIEDAIYPSAGTHRAVCQRCAWSVDDARRPAAIERAALHVEETGHEVVVRAIDIDWIVAVPMLAKYAPRRILGEPE
jgi:hypothetical protein